MTTIMSMGDSITEGVLPGGYRDCLYWDLESGGTNIQFVGDQYTNPGGYLPDNETAHEGVGGITTNQMNDYVSASQIVAATHPDMVLLLIGTNDVGRDHVSPWDEVDRLSNLIDTIHGQSWGTKILVANLLARTDDGPGGFIDQTNSLIPNMLAGKNNTVFVNMHDALTTNDLVDGLHPNAQGNAIMGGTWGWAIATQLLGHTPW